jgi:hypothetical protein
MERFGCHSIPEHHRMIKEVVMESRTFHILPIRCGSEIEAIDILLKKPHQDNPRMDCEYYEGDDEIDTLVRNNSSKYSRRLRDRVESHKRHGNLNASHNIDTMDVQDDEASPSMVLRTYSRKDLSSQQFQQLQLPQQQDRKALTGGRAITATERRIAQLRSAGLSISSKVLSPLSFRRIGTKGLRSSLSKEEKRQGSKKATCDMISKDFRYRDLASNNSGALKALLEKDSRHRGRISSAPKLPPLTGILQTKQSHRFRYSALAPKTPPPRLQLAKKDALDPIIAARPSYKGMRVSQKEYPDPEAFGWHFVGSCGERQIEFFEKESSSEMGLVVLEFHYTTGTVKATLEHPLRGESLLAFALGGSKVFPHGLAPKIYRKILLDPIESSSSSNPW